MVEIEQPVSSPLPPLEGLTSIEANRRLEAYGPNVIPENRKNTLPGFLHYLWGPVPWLLEVSLVLELLFDRLVVAALIGLFLLVNALINELQEGQSYKSIHLPFRTRMVIVLRDSQWQTIPIRELVPGDVIRLSPGDIIPADVEISSGQLTLEKFDQNGSFQAEKIRSGMRTGAGNIVRKGEAVAVVTATGAQRSNRKIAREDLSKRTSGLLQQPVSIFARDLVILNTAIGLVVLASAPFVQQPYSGSVEMIPFALILLAISLPSGLSLTLKRIALQGITELAKKEVFITRVKTIEKMAEMQVLCLDKTGLLTENKLTVAALLPYSPYTEEDVIRLAALASDEASRDPVDRAILEHARAAGALPAFVQRTSYHPFNSQVKRWEAVYETDDQVLRVMKGLPNVLFKLSRSDNGLEREVDRLASLGYQVLAVAVGDDAHMQISGLVALKDPLRVEAKSLISQLLGLGVSIVMVTRDEFKAAQSFAHEIGLNVSVSPIQSLHHPNHTRELECYTIDGATYAEALPEDKQKLVEIYQQSHCTVGVTGDGVNDLDALRKADVGVATANASAAAQAAAGLILGKTGLRGIIEAINISRHLSQQMLAYSLTTLVMSLVATLFIGLEWILAGTVVMTPLLMILYFFATVLLRMTSFTVRSSTTPRSPYQINLHSLTWIILSLAGPILLLCYAVFWMGKILFHLPLACLQTLVFALLVFCAQGLLYLLRERGHAWTGSANKALLIGSLIVVLLVTLIATLGILMNPIPLTIILGMIGLILLYLFALDFLKVRLFQWFEVQ